MTRTILVTGATGTTGAEVVHALPARGFHARAAARSREKARSVLGTDIEVVEFDFERPETWGAAFDGVEGLFLVRPPEIADVKRVIGPALTHFANQGGGHVVFLSVMGAGGNPFLPHHKLERLIQRLKLPFTHLRPSFFMQNLSTFYQNDIRDRNEIFVPAGSGRTSFIDVRDIAQVATTVITRQEHIGQAYTLTGAEALTYFEVAKIFSEVLQRDIVYANPSPRQYSRRMLAQGIEKPFVRVMGRIYCIARWGLAAGVTPDLRRLLGRPPTTMKQFVRDHVDIWR